ncbi:nitrate- and nitrite sensing domain-containing protein, partial [Acinetobacter baumannii]|uniref:nitrate- and nitrite sensing domain-containing protein n=1 Tax=Acinetobacter baumannii TaxID=470 RepID=UPI001D17D0F7
QLGELWFELHTGRIDAMKHVETRLEQDLLQQCRQSIERIRKDCRAIASCSTASPTCTPPPSRPSCSACRPATSTQLGELWFELHTGRIDAMKHVETRLEQDLLQQCR